MKNEISLIPPTAITGVSARPLASPARTLPKAPNLATLLWLVVATTIIGCSNALQSAEGARPHPATERSRSALYGELLKRHEDGERRALRVKVDKARNRLWVLDLQQVYVYDITGKQLIRQVALPAWSVAGIKCSPDLILDRSGSALISSNAEPRLWQIDAENFGIKEHAIRLHAKEGWDIGFGALSFAADGTLFGLTSYAGSLWRIDIAKSSADEIKLSERVLNTCALNTPRESAQGTQQHAVVLCAATDKDSRRIELAPDLTRARVSREACLS